MTIDRRTTIHVWAALVVAASLMVVVWSRDVPRDAERQHDWSAIRFSDEKHYYQYSAQRFSEIGLSFLADEDSLRSPPMPWLWHWLWQRSMVATRIANIGLVILGCYLVGCIGRRFDAQLLTTILAAFSYQLAFYTSSILTEPLAFSFVCFSLYSVDRLVCDLNKVRWIIATSVFMTFAIFSRPSLLPWPFILALLVVVSRFWKSNVSERDDDETVNSLRRKQLLSIRHSLLIIILISLFVAPWLIKNKVCFGVARIANGLGAVLFLGSETKTHADEPGFSGMQWPNMIVQGPKGHMSLEGERRLKQAAIANIRADSGSWCRLMPVKAARVLFGGPRWHFQPGKTLPESLREFGRTRGLIRFLWWTCFGSVAVMYGLVGLVILTKQRHPLGIAGGAVVLTLLGVHVATYAMPRFLVPAWPGVALGAAYAIKVLGWRGHTFVVSSAFVVIATTVFWHHGDAPREISKSRKSAFEMEQHVRFDELNSKTYSISCHGRRPPFNTCIFLSACIEPLIDGDRSIEALLILNSDGNTKSRTPEPIPIEMIADGSTHYYLQCIELNTDWKNTNWQSLTCEFQFGQYAKIKSFTMGIGH